MNATRIPLPLRPTCRGVFPAGRLDARRYAVIIDGALLATHRYYWVAALHLWRAERRQARWEAKIERALLRGYVGASAATAYRRCLSDSLNGRT